MNAPKGPRRFWYRLHRCEAYLTPKGWVGWARRYPDRTTDYLPTAYEAMEAARVLVDATLAELRNEPVRPDML